MADLREADGLLQRAIEKVDERSKLDTAQVQHTGTSSGTMRSGSLLSWPVSEACFFWV